MSIEGALAVSLLVVAFALVMDVVTTVQLQNRVERVAWAVARANALGLWQPDMTWCGGITAGRRIIDLARDAGVPVSPHRGAEVWGLHLIAASDWADFAEMHSDHINARRDELWLDEPQVVDGYIAPPDRPGFGVTLNEAML